MTKISGSLQEVLENQVREAFDHLVSRPGGWVALVRLREHLSDIDRRTMDSVLRGLNRHNNVYLIPEANSKILTHADQEASLQVGDEAKHLISINGYCTSACPGCFPDTVS